MLFSFIVKIFPNIGATPDMFLLLSEKYAFLVPMVGRGHAWVLK
jgi:hypothetical protein